VTHRTRPHVRRHQYAHVPPLHEAADTDYGEHIGEQTARQFACDYCGQRIILTSGPTFLCGGCHDPHPIEESCGICPHNGCDGTVVYTGPADLSERT
jgi:hypothetical protein